MVIVNLLLSIVFKTRYAVDLNWFCQWQRFVDFEDIFGVSVVPPGPVDNSNLFIGKIVINLIGSMLYLFYGYNSQTK